MAVEAVSNFVVGKLANIIEKEFNGALGVKKDEFKYHIMLSVSQQFSLTDLLKKMLRQLKYSIPENQDVTRYLIILDDVWEVDLWNHLTNVLPDATNGSRVLMTSRNIHVAKSADPMMKPYELEFLNDKESLDLLLKKVIPHPKPDEECPNDLVELGKELSTKCKGSPLALIVLGGILSTKERSYPAWKKVLRTMNWQLDCRDCMRILAMSYEDMPCYLKACFLYLASYPEDYKICAKCLIRMWVAEEFIPREDNNGGNS